METESIDAILARVGHPARELYERVAAGQSEEVRKSIDKLVRMADAYAQQRKREVAEAASPDDKELVSREEAT
jgi:hypothetical protein